MLAPRLHGLALAALLVVPPPVALSVASIPLEDLVRYSDTIVVGRVERVVTIHRDVTWPENLQGLDWKWKEEVPIAVVAVLETLKGAPPAKTVDFLACGTWACDTSRAQTGETALLFLTRAEWVSKEGERLQRELREVVGDAPSFTIAHSGRGRMPLFGSQQTLTPGGVLMRSKDPTAPGKYSFAGTIPMAEMRSLIAGAVSRQTPALHAEQHGGSKGARWRLDVWNDGYAQLRGTWEEFGLEPERVAELWRLLETERFPDLPAHVGAESNGAEWRTLELETAAGRHVVGLSSIDAESLPAGDRAAELASVLRLWIHVRGLVDDPNGLDTREQDNALLERLR
jgi:hypothetical protein